MEASLIPVGSCVRAPTAVAVALLPFPQRYRLTDLPQRVIKPSMTTKAADGSLRLPTRFEGEGSALSFPESRRTFFPLAWASTSPAGNPRPRPGDAPSR